MSDYNLYDSLKCIWMASNIVDYKLCDNEFQCDDCIFDKVMRNRFSNKDIKNANVPDILQNVIQNIDKEEYNSSFVYFHNHIVTKQIFGNTYYLGISNLALCFLDNVNEIEHCSEKDIIFKGQPIIKVTGNWGDVTISSPVNFTCLGDIEFQKNFRLREKWLGLVQITRDEIELNSVSEQKFKEDQENLKNMLQQIKINSPEIGATMYDGGIKANFIYQVIGANRYIQLLKTLFQINM